MAHLLADQINNYGSRKTYPNALHKGDHGNS